jgi:hypothetical protein
MSDNGVPIETIADLVGHASTAVTEEVYRHQLKPVITRGAERDHERHLQAEPHQIRVRQWPPVWPPALICKIADGQVLPGRDGRI